MIEWAGRIVSCASAIATVCLAALERIDLISLGALLIAIATGVTAAFYGSKSKAERQRLLDALTAAQASGDAWKQELDAQKERADRLAEDLERSITQTAALKFQRDEALARTDITRIEEQIATVITLLGKGKPST